MENIAKRLNAHITAHPFDSGDSDCDTVLDQLYQAYAESHESDPLEIRDGFKELDSLLEHLLQTCPLCCVKFRNEVINSSLQLGHNIFRFLVVLFI